MSELIFHHVGIACHDLEKDLAHYRAIGYVPDGNQFIDPLQGIKGIFLVGAGPRLELLQNLPGSSTLDPFLESGTKMYHLGFEVPEGFDLKKFSTTIDGWQVREPQFAVAFQRRICFFCLRNLQLIELIGV